MIELLEEYLGYLAMRNYSPETVYAHRLQLKLFFSYLLSVDLSDPKTVTKQDIRRFQVFLYERVNKRGKQDAPQSQNNTLAKVSVFYKWLLAEERIATDPTKDLLYAKVPQTLPALSPTTTEARRLMHGSNGNTLLDARDKVLLETLYGSGIRAGEARRVRIADLDLAAGTLRVNLGKGGKDRVVPLTAVSIALLKRYLAVIRPALVEGKPDTGHLFVSLRKSSLGRSTPGLIVQRAARMAGLTKRVYPHALRHACLTHMLRNSKHAHQNILRPLMELAGHADLKTLHRYTAVDIQELKEIHAKTHPRELEHDL